jgi:hypothetical protein
VNRDVSGPVIDASVELDAALGALRAGAGAVRLAVAPPLDAPAEEGFGPEPKRPLVAELTIGAPDVALDGGAKSAAQSVDVEVEPLAWGSWGGKPFQRFASKIAIVLADGRKLAVSERVVEDEAAAQSAADELAGALRAALGLSEQGAAGSPSEPGDAPAAKPSSANGDDAVRFGIRLEGDRLVLRDYDSRGPREGAGKFRVLALIALALAVLVWARLVGTVRASGELSSLLGLGAIALVLSLAAFAMNEIARHANKYVADSAPLAWFGDDHVVVAPWASLRGAIDLRPEGRYGAAIKIAEVNAVVVRDDQESKAITLETEHGPIDVLYVATDEAAARWRRAVERALVSVAAPQKRAIPLVRASVSASA